MAITTIFGKDPGSVVGDTPSPALTLLYTGSHTDLPTSVSDGDMAYGMAGDEKGAVYKFKEEGLEWEKVEDGGGSGLPDVTPSDEDKVPVVSSEGEWTVGYPPIDISSIVDEMQSRWFANVWVQTGDYPPVTSDKSYEDFLDDVYPVQNHPLFAYIDYVDTADSDKQIRETCPIFIEVSYYMGQLEGATARAHSYALNADIVWTTDGVIME